MHLFDEDAAMERALCGEDTDAGDRRGVRGYQEERQCDKGGGAICQNCKSRAVAVTGNIIDDLRPKVELERRTSTAS